VAWASYHTGEWVDLVRLVYLVYFVDLVQPNKRDKPNKPNNGLLPLAAFFSILRGFSIDGGKMPPYYTNSIGDDYDSSAPSRITPCSAAGHESRTLSRIL
jgi:hypothetical protein